MFSLHDDKTIAFEGRDVATLRPGLPATLIARIVEALGAVMLDPDNADVWTDAEHGAAIKSAVTDARSQATQEACDAVLKACNALDPGGADETITKVMRASQAAIRASRKEPRHARLAQTQSRKTAPGI